MMRALSGCLVLSMVFLACAQASRPSKSDASAGVAPAVAAPVARADTSGPTLAQIAARNDSLRADRQIYVNRIREKIKGKEQLPAEEVYQDIRILRGRTAGQLLGMMSGGFSNSLGVSCSHCHVTEDFSKDDKPTKQIARDMWGMMRTINDSLIANIKNIKSANPGVNCGTCHNGRARPGFGPEAEGRARRPAAE